MTYKEYMEKMNNDPNRITMICKKCNIKYDNILPGKSAICLECLSKLIPLENAPKCPTCGSINIEPVSQTRRSLNRWAFGINNPTARAQFECQNCGYKW